MYSLNGYSLLKMGSFFKSVGRSSTAIGQLVDDQGIEKCRLNVNANRINSKTKEKKKASNY